MTLPPLTLSILCMGLIAVKLGITGVLCIQSKNMIGLSKERPILDHQAKAHIFEIQRISCEIHPKPYKIRCFNKNSSVWGVQEGGYDPGFHEILVHSPSPAFIKLNSFG